MPELLTRGVWNSFNKAPRAPIRIVHMGLGAFHRSHQACFTQMGDPHHEWGIAAFTGRSPQAAERLRRQGCLYTVLIRGAAGDSALVVDRIVEADDGADLVRFCELLASPATAMVTLTLTEAGYRVASGGGPDLTDPLVLADLRELEAGSVLGIAAQPHTALARLVLGLEARRRAGCGPLAVVPCDNLPSNGETVRLVVREFARHVDQALVRWIDSQVSFVSTSVDRITPRPTPEDIELAAEISGWDDQCPVVTEPFMDWVLCGDFPAGRPEWELAGAQFVSDIYPFEQRKLRMLNGAHTLLAAVGWLLGHRTVASAAADPRCMTWLQEYWDESERYLPGGADLDIDSYREKLRARFLNSKIEHRLEQIAEDTETKIRLRILPTIRAALREGTQSRAATRAVAAWAVLSLPEAFDSSHLAELVAGLEPAMASSADFMELLAAQAATFRTFKEAVPGGLSSVGTNDTEQLPAL